MVACKTKPKDIPTPPLGVEIRSKDKRLSLVAYPMHRAGRPCSGGGAGSSGYGGVNIRFWREGLHFVGV